MRVAILHYHLRRGGVTRVIEHSLTALVDRGIEVVVLGAEGSGLRPDLREYFEEVPELAYQSGSSRISVDDLDRVLRAVARRRLGAEPDVWHVHNHHLAKNTSLTELVAVMAKRGERLLLHVHDFPEDGRAENYRVLLRDLGGSKVADGREPLYPVGERILYGVLNSRDFAILGRAGIPEEQRRLLANPVAANSVQDRSGKLPGLHGERLILYPTRAIRRKNLGEFLLWAALGAEDEVYGCTLAPENPSARPIYERWVSLAETLRLPTEFELGDRPGLAFEELIAASELLLSTSVAEGFGLAFLEPWLLNRPIVGRNLPAITSDFVAENLRLDHLYDRLKVPLNWIDTQSLRRSLERAVAENYARYSLPLADELVEQTYQDLTAGGVIDFGRLDESFQECVIRRVCVAPSCRAEIVPSGLQKPRSSSVLTHNREVVIDRFGLPAYGEKLEHCYRSLLEGRDGKLEWIEPRRVLDQFLDPTLFSFLRS